MPREHDDAIDATQYGVLHIASNSDFRVTTATRAYSTWGCEVCEVCGEPLSYSSYHICNRCRLAAQKFKDCLTEEDLGRV